MAKDLWRPPRLHSSEDNEKERRATWLELFYDLVFVVAIAELAHNLEGDTSLSGFFGCVFLFIMNSVINATSRLWEKLNPW
jgi:low temperature requirement protein LtrA